MSVEVTTPATRLERLARLTTAFGLLSVAPGCPSGSGGTAASDPVRHPGPESPAADKTKRAGAPPFAIGGEEIPKSIEEDYPLTFSARNPYVYALVGKPVEDDWGSTFSQTGLPKPPCDGSFYERISTFPTLAHCAAVRIANDLVLTSRHCLRGAKPSDYALLKNYDRREFLLEEEINKSNLRQLERVCLQGEGAGVNDWVVLRFSPQEDDIDDLEIGELAYGDEGIAYQFPRGVPLMEGGMKACFVHSNPRNPYSHTVVSSQQHSSGAPVFSDEENPAIVGMHTGRVSTGVDNSRDLVECTREVVCGTKCGDRKKGCAYGRMIPGRLLKKIIKRAREGCPASPVTLRFTRKGELQEVVRPDKPAKAP